MPVPDDLLVNLDGMWPDDLRAYAEAITAATIPAPADRRVADLLARYARIKADAMTFRAAGDIKEALMRERVLELIYNRLPEYARW
jgi:hypothetical protein